MRQRRWWWLVVAAAVLTSGPASARDLDIVFVLDTTGSMAGELREVKERVHQLAESVAAARAGDRLRFGVVAYRDRGDAYVTLTSPLTTDHAATAAFLATLRAEGGGDGPEDVLSALAAAFAMGWGAGERRVVLVGDAPPHLDYPDGPRPDDLLAHARHLEVVVDAIGCRSLPPDGVRFFRATAYATEGRYQHIGRVRGEEAGLTSAVLATVVGPRPGGRPVDVRRVGRRGPPDGPGLLALLLPAAAAEQASAGCFLELHLPAGVGLAAEPRVQLGPDGTTLGLDLTTGDGGVELLALDECPAGNAPVHVEIGG